MNARAVTAFLSLLSAAAGISLAQPEPKPEPKPAAPPGKAPAQPGADDGFRRAFTVEKANLGATGGNRYLDLSPGAVHIYRDNEVKLTVTVLDQVREVDGVTTRVIEEREEKQGALIEISRNFFAADKKTGDVYYFGEEVDIYKDGKISGHEGAWLSGENGAKFGLAIAAKPRKGDRYYQEVAPGIALDRAEVTATDETLKVAAGNFRHCIHITETTPLETGTSHKWYAPDIGLIKDDECVLVSHKPAPKP